MSLNSRLNFAKKLGISLFLLACSTAAFPTVNNHFEAIKKDPNALYAFLKTMPKGGELHYHLAGGAYPETMLALATTGPYCLNKQNLALSKIVEYCAGIKSSELLQPSLYQQIIRAWSMKNFIAGEESGHDHFFASFEKFMPIVADYSPHLLAEIMQRAADQNELYLEILILPDNGKALGFADTPLQPQDFAARRKQLLANPAFQANIQFTVDETARFLRQARTLLNCEQSPKQPVCQLTVKFQDYVLREQPLEAVFAQALNGFEAASRSPDLVGVNLVQPEDGLISLRDYRQQMEIFAFLHQLYPQVHISLHAGELAVEAVTPQDLRFHIQEAIKTGQAERIGHGVSVALENDAEALLKEMATKKIAVEINLTSNEKILGVSGKNHPLNYYLAHGVPVVLSTDDEGLLRTDLTHQYVDAVLKHNVDYPTLKMINRNALTYSFLPGKSLWEDATKALPVKVCENLQSPACLQFIKENTKARIQWDLENKLRVFENAYRSVEKRSVLEMLN